MPLGSDKDRAFTNVSFAISRTDYEIIRKLIPHGVRSQFLRKSVELAIGKLRESGDPYKYVGRFLAGAEDPFEEGSDGPSSE